MHMIQKIFIRWCCHSQENFAANCIGWDHIVDIRSVDLLKMAKEAGKKRPNFCMQGNCCIPQLPINRFGKVLWRSDGRHSVSDEVLLGGRHRVQDLEKSGNVSVENVLGGQDTRWCFKTM